MFLICDRQPSSHWSHIFRVSLILLKKLEGMTSVTLIHGTVSYFKAQKREGAHRNWSLSPRAWWFTFLSHSGALWLTGLITHQEISSNINDHNSCSQSPNLREILSRKSTARAIACIDLWLHAGIVDAAAIKCWAPNHCYCRSCGHAFAPKLVGGKQNFVGGKFDLRLSLLAAVTLYIDIWTPI